MWTRPIGGLVFHDREVPGSIPSIHLPLPACYWDISHTSAWRYWVMAQLSSVWTRHSGSGPSSVSVSDPAVVCRRDWRVTSLTLRNPGMVWTERWNHDQIWKLHLMKNTEKVKIIRWMKCTLGPLYTFTICKYIMGFIPSNTWSTPFTLRFVPYLCHHVWPQIHNSKYVTKHVLFSRT